MPITIFPSPSKTGHNRKPIVTSSQSLLTATSLAWAPVSVCKYDNYGRPIVENAAKPENRPILSSSFQDLDSAPVVPLGNALVSGILGAFQQDLHLVLRPDDVWLAILTQFSFYVNANSENLRDHFVNFKDKKTLKIDCSRPVYDLMDTFALTAQLFSKSLETMVVHPELHEWMLPNFSTTTDEDKEISSMVMMGTLQKYAESVCWVGCGFPISVTLLGEAEDWQLILARIQKLPKYGKQPGAWSKLLTAILDRIIATFYTPHSPEIRDFWLRACHSNGQDGSSLGRYLSGWITAFCFWTEEGQPLDCNFYAAGQSVGRGVVDMKDEPTAADLEAKDVRPLELDKVRFHLVYNNGGLERSPGNLAGIPKSVVTFPMVIRNFATGLQHNVTIVAGLVGMTLGKTSSEEDCYQPRSGWWTLQDSVEKF